MGSKRLNQQYGIQGYEVKLWHHDVDKPIVFGIHQDKNSKKPRHYLDPLIKQKEHVPPPTTYNVTGDFKLNYNAMYSKSPRVMEADLIERRAKRTKHPD
jgi:hypothetical protein